MKVYAVQLNVIAVVVAENAVAALKVAERRRDAIVDDCEVQYDVTEAVSVPAGWKGCLAYCELPDDDPRTQWSIETWLAAK